MTGTKRKVLLLNPPGGLYRRDDRCQSSVNDQTVRAIFPPLDLAYLASIAEEEGATPLLRDYPAERADWNTFVHDLDTFHPDLVLFTATAPTLPEDMQVPNIVKERLDNTLVVGRGEPLNFVDRILMEETPALDIVLRGEPFDAFRVLIRGGDLGACPDVSYRNNGEVLQTEKPESFTDLDELPFPARRHLNNDLYRSPETRRQMTTVLTSQGCPYRCVFCPVVPLTGSMVRFRKPEAVVEELKLCVERQGIRDFLFHADTFTLKKNWVMELCDRIRSAGLDIRWGCNSRVNTIDGERLEAMRDAGCWVVGFGVETGDDEHLKLIRKDATADQAREAVRLCREHGVRSHCFLVFGFPWDTHESIENLVRFAKELDSDFFDFNLAYPIPGTELFKMVVEEQLCDVGRLAHGGYHVAAVRTRTVGARELEKLRRKALWSLYLRPSYIVRTFRQAGSVPVAFNYLREAGLRVRNLLGV